MLFLSKLFILDKMKYIQYLVQASKKFLYFVINIINYKHKYYNLLYKICLEVYLVYNIFPSGELL